MLLGCYYAYGSANSSTLGFFRIVTYKNPRPHRVSDGTNNEIQR